MNVDSVRMIITNLEQYKQYGKIVPDETQKLGLMVNVGENLKIAFFGKNDAEDVEALRYAQSLNDNKQFTDLYTFLYGLLNEDPPTDDIVKRWTPPSVSNS